jgi:hypothetical protein
MNASHYLAVLMLGSLVAGSPGALESAREIPDGLREPVPEALPPLGIKVRKLYLSGKISEADSAVIEIYADHHNLEFAFTDLPQDLRKSRGMQKPIFSGKLRQWAQDAPDLQTFVQRLERIREEHYDSDSASFEIEDAPDLHSLLGSLLDLLRFYSVSKEVERVDRVLLDLHAIGFWER